MRTDLKERILRVLVHVQQNLDRELPLEELAEVAGFSPFHFHRVFTGMVGETVMKYVRRLRLERAAMRLKHGRRKVTDIAFEAGYEAHEAFTRAFRSAFGCPPSVYRARRDAAQHLDSPANAHYAPDAGVVGFEPLTPERDGMQVEIKTLEPMRVAFLRHVGPYQEVGETWERLCDWAGLNGLFGADTRLFGACYDDPDVTAADRIRYDSCLTVDDDFTGEGEIGAQTIPGGRFAVTLHEGPYAALGEIYAALYGRWLPASGFEPGAPPALEFYLNDPDSTPPEDLLTEIWVRVQ